MPSQDDTLFLVGSGAVQGAWEPVISSLRSIGFPDLATADAAAFAMARLVYIARMAYLRADDALGRHRDEVVQKLVVHGRATDARHLYLPTEIAEEPFRESSERVHLNNARARLVRAIDESTKLVIYALAVSALDTELGEVIAAGLHNGRVREIYIVNPSYVEVAERVATLGRAGTKELPIYGLSPQNLQRRWLFDVRDIEAERSRGIASRARAGDA